MKHPRVAAPRISNGIEAEKRRVLSRNTRSFDNEEPVRKTQAAAARVSPRAAKQSGFNRRRQSADRRTVHPSIAIFNEIQSFWPDRTIKTTPAFFSLAEDVWDQVPATDLESFYCHIRDANPRATTIVTAYSVGAKPMLVAHYESPSNTCHRIWSIEPDQTLRTVYSSPVESTRRHAAAA